MSVLAVSPGALPDRAAVVGAVAALPEGAPIVILIHGYRYAPGVAGHDPHALILSPGVPARRGRMVSWPRHLRLTGPGSLAIAFGWAARGSIWGAYGRAGTAAADLARLIACIAAEAPDRPVQIVAHSLGARVALAALPLCPPGAVCRMILIAAAAFRAEARAALASPAGRGLEVLHVRGPENRLFDALLSAAFPWKGPSLGAGAADLPGWVDLALGQPGIPPALARLGYPIRPTMARVCHWSGYTRPGVFALYRAVLAGRLSVDALAIAPHARPHRPWRWPLPRRLA